jgi:hypothetical protein
VKRETGARMKAKRPTRGMDQRQEIARMTAEVLSEFISPVRLLTLDTDSKTGEVSGRFRSGPMVFTYKIKGERVSYSPLGGTKQEAAAKGKAERRSDATGSPPSAVDHRELQQLPLAEQRNPVEHARRDAWVRRSVAYVAALLGLPEARIDSYLAAEVRMDAAGGKRQCTVGYACGATCIERRKEGLVTTRDPGRAKRLHEFVTGGAGGTAKVAAAQLDPVKKKAAGANRNPEAAKVAKRTMKAMAVLEREITPQMIALADVLGGEMDGLEYRIKTEDSLARKIADEADGEAQFEATAKEMSDVVRYTMKFDSETYVDGVEGALKALEERGMKMRVKNFWLPNQPYRGINVAVTEPSGETFELQFHTPESLETKHKTHPIYDDYREEKDNAMRRKQWDTMVPIQNRLKTPLTPFRGKAKRRMKERLTRIGTLKQFSFQTAEEAGLV